MMQGRELLEELEHMVDVHGLSQVLSVLSEIAWLKSEHVVSAWGDVSLGREWERAGKVCDTASGRQSVLNVSPEVKR